MSDKMNYCIDCVSYFLNKEKNRYFCADNKTRIEDVPCEFFEQRCDDDIDNPWHTGTPTEEGWYVCKLNGVDIYETHYFTGNNWCEHVEKWQKIEYKEATK